MIHREILDEYLITYDNLINRLEVRERCIEQFAQDGRYREEVPKLNCFLGIKSLTGLSILVGTGDFARFKASPIMFAISGCPGEHSSGASIKRTYMTKAGNSEVQRLLIEADQNICKGQIGCKSRDLLARQKGNPFTRKYYRMIRSGKKRNALLRQLHEYWLTSTGGMMKNHL